MFDYLRNLTKTDAEKRQEALTAYLDGALSPDARRAFEARLAQDSDLQADLEQQRAVRQSLRQLPQRRVSRNFTLDPALYGRPARQPLVQYYPALRAATVLTAVLFFFAISLGLYTSADESAMTAAPAADVAMEPAPGDASTAVEVTRVVTEMEEPAAETMPDSQTGAAELDMEPAAEEEAMEEAAEDEAMDEAVEEAAEEPAGEEAAPVEATAVPTLLPAVGGASSAAATAEPATDDGEAAPVVQATASLAPLPTATQSLLPRATATEPPLRGYLAPEELSTELPDSTAVAQFNYSVTSESAAEREGTANEIEDTETAVYQLRHEERISPTWSGVQILAVALLLLLVVLLAVTLYARRQL